MVKGLMTSAANEFLWLLYDQPTPDVTFPSEASFDLVSERHRAVWNPSFLSDQREKLKL